MIMKEVDKSVWENNYKNKSNSGIEIRDKNGELVNFITIRHDEILEKDTTHRIAIRLDEDGKLLVPPAQTFDEIIQAKRRHQMLLYGSGNSNSSSSAIISSRTARRVAAARQVAATSTITPRPLPRDTRRSSSKKSKKKSSSLRRDPVPRNIQDSNVNEPQPPLAEPAPAPPSGSAIKIEACLPPTLEPVPSTSMSSPASKSPKKSHSTKSSANHMVTSLKDLTKKDNPLLRSIDPKEVKMLLKSATPGATIVLPNGTVIKKSRRGGARAGAGRKRSRPIDPNLPKTPQTPINDSQQQTIENSNEQPNLETQTNHSIDVKTLSNIHVPLTKLTT